MSTQSKAEHIQYALDHLAILNRYAAYTYAVDSVDADGYADCFTEDGVNDLSGFRAIMDLPKKATFWELANEKGIVTGPDNLRRMVKLGFPPFHAHHVTANILIRSIEGDTAKGSAYFVVFTLDQGRIEHFGRYEDELRRCADGQWRFSSRIDRAFYERDRKAEKAAQA